MMRTAVLLLIVALALAACSTSSAEVPPAVTEAPVITEVPPDTGVLNSTASPADTSSSPEAPGSSAGMTTYAIVPEESTVTYEVGETFFNENNRFNTAIGTTNGVTGEIFVDTQNPLNSSLGPLSVDISQFRSDSDRRDNAIRTRFLQTSQFPQVTFIPKEISGLPGSYNLGDPISFQVSGDLTIREVTVPATFQVNGVLTGDEITGTAETTFLMSDYGFGPIEIGGILGTEDNVKISINFIARP